MSDQIENQEIDHKDDKDVIEHYGTPRHSGRYPWGSGKNPQRNKNFLQRADELRAQNMSDKEIAKVFGMSTGQYRNARKVYKYEKQMDDQLQAYKLREKGWSNVAIADKLGVSEGTVRNMLDPNKKKQENRITTIANELENKLKERPYLDVGEGVNRQLGVSEEYMNAVFIGTGFLLGLMLGLKLTIIVYCVALGGTLILFYGKLQTPVKTIGLFTLGGLLGFLVIDGWWMLVLYEHFGNPFFPYFNNVFKSPYYAEQFLTYKDFYKKTLSDYFLFPYKASFQLSERITSESPMLDVRLALGYTLLWIAIITSLFKRNLSTVIKRHKNIVFLIIFSVISYALWLQIFSIIRYAIPFEMLIALFIVLYFATIRPKDLIKFALWGSGCIILFFMLMSGLPYASWGNRLGETKLVYENNVKLPDNSLLISLSPSTGLAATQIVKNNPDVKLVNETSNLTIEGKKLHDIIDVYKKNSSYIAYLVSLKSPVREFDRYTPTDMIKGDNLDEVFENLQFIIKTELKPEHFYCRDISNSLYSFMKTFLCIDKRDKDSIFPANK